MGDSLEPISVNYDDIFCKVCLGRRGWVDIRGRRGSNSVFSHMMGIVCECVSGEDLYASDLFDNPAYLAEFIDRWRKKPRVIDGHPIPDRLRSEKEPYPAEE
jgi:hypothetical protein